MPNGLFLLASVAEKRGAGGSVTIPGKYLGFKLVTPGSKKCKHSHTTKVWDSKKFGEKLIDVKDGEGTHLELFGCNKCPAEWVHEIRRAVV